MVNVFVLVRPLPRAGFSRPGPAGPALPSARPARGPKILRPAWPGLGRAGPLKFQKFLNL